MAKRFLIWFWSGGGGGSTFAVNLARRLRLQFSDEAVALSLRADDPALERARTEGLRVHAADIVSDRRRPLATIAALAQSRSVLEAHAADADCVIVPMNFAAAAPLSATLNKPLVYCAHDPEPHPGDYARLGQRTTQAVMLTRATRVVALSEYAARQLRKRGFQRKLVTAPIASVFEPRTTPPTAEGPTRLLFAGRMIAYKGVDLLADALPSLAGRSDWRLTIAGFGPALDDAAVARFALPQVARVEASWLSDAALDALIADTDIVLAPYRSATQSGIVAEAMAYGKPCVVTIVGALMEQIANGAAGWAVDATPEAIAGAIERALDRPDERAARAAAAHEAAREAWQGNHWTWLESV